MATKFVNRVRVRRARFATCLTLALATALGGCGGMPTKTKTAAAQAAPEVLSSKEFLPVRQYDKEGAVLPFVPTPNPYLAIKGRIDKDAVEGFIAARKALNNGDRARAQALLKQVTEEDRSLAGPWVLLGDIAAEDGKVDDAIAAYRKAIAVNRLNVNAYLPLALLLREQGRFVEAQNVYTDALRVWKDFPEAHLNLAILYDLYLNDPLQAQQHMEAYQFLHAEADATVAKWLSELRGRTGIEPNLYIGPSSTSQISKRADEKNET